MKDEKATDSGLLIPKWIQLQKLSIFTKNSLQKSRFQAKLEKYCNSFC